MGDFDAGAYLPRARRRADVSQRELAVTLGVGQSTVARWESGAAAVPLPMLVRALSVAGLRLAVVDGGGEEVLPFDPDAVRDNAGRRFPAHLDVAPPWPMPANRGNGQRFDRPAPRAWYSLRPSRAVDLARPGAAAAERASTDHPTSTALRALAARHRQRQVRPAPAFAPCSCDDECLLGPGCPAACPCQCEPAGGAAPHTVTP